MQVITGDKIMNRLIALACVAACASPLAVSPAQAATDCNAWSLLQAADARPSLARVAAAGHVPISVAAPTRRQPYLVTGDDVIVLASEGGRACVTYTAPTKAAGSTTGWVDAHAIQPPQDAVEATDWGGTWRSGPEQEISMTPAGPDTYKVEGNATYGATDPARVARGAVNLGSIDGVIHPARGQADLRMGTDPGDCHVQFWRLGAYLVAADYGGCGGMNVTFTGAYRQAADSPRAAK
jgi:hypothetical protein